MNKSSVLACPNDKLLQPESIKAFAESHKDSWKLLLVDHHPDLKVKLDSLYRNYVDGKEVKGLFRKYAERLTEIAKQYSLPNTIWAHCNDWLVELEWIVEDELHDSKKYVFDQMMAYNTLISSILPMTVIPDLIWLDARDFIRTDNGYGNPKLIGEIDWTLLEEGRRYISQANLGSTSENNSTVVAEAGKEILWTRGL